MENKIIPYPETTPAGGLHGPLGERIKTDCLWPSFTQVELLVTPDGEGFVVSDDGGAAQSAWTHGGDKDYTEGCLANAALRYGVELEGMALVARAKSAEWKRSAILAVANASARAAYAAISS